MRNRCSNPRNQDYKHYGARGISVCIRWESFSIFSADVGPHPGPEWTLDRINSNGNYEPDNVRWATRPMQVRNRPNFNKLDEAKASAIRNEYIRGITKQVDLAVKYGVTQAHVSRIIRGVQWYELHRP